MTNKTEIVRVPRELLERWADRFSKAQMFKDSTEVRAVLAAPAEDVRAVVEEPVAEVVSTRKNSLPLIINGVFQPSISSEEKVAMFAVDLPVGTKLYLHPQCPVVLPERTALRDVIAQAIGGDAYDCTRVWQAWGVGTMSEDDFVPIVDQEERLSEIVDACLDEIERLKK